MISKQKQAPYFNKVGRLPPSSGGPAPGVGYASSSLQGKIPGTAPWFSNGMPSTHSGYSNSLPAQPAAIQPKMQAPRAMVPDQILKRSQAAGGSSAKLFRPPARLPVQARFAHRSSILSNPPFSTSRAVQRSDLFYRTPAGFHQPGRSTGQRRFFNTNVLQPTLKRAMTPKGTVWEEEAPPTGKTSSKRTAAGFDNPSWTTKEMLPLTEAAAVTKAPAGSTHAEKVAFYSDPKRKFVVEGGLTVTGKRKTILGHKHGHSAGQMWNKRRHKKPRTKNLEFNRQRKRYHGLEESKASSASGSSEARYHDPTPFRGSHRSHFDPSHPDYYKKTPFPRWKVIRERGDTTPLPPGSKPKPTKYSYSKSKKGKISYRGGAKKKTS